MFQTIEKDNGIESKELTDLSEEMWPQDRVKEYTKEELQKDETWEEIVDLFEYTTDKILFWTDNDWIVNSSFGWNFWKTNWSSESEIPQKKKYKENMLKIIKDSWFRESYKKTEKETVSFTDINNTVKSITYLQKDFWKEFSTDQLKQLTIVLLKLKDSHDNTELIKNNANTFILYDQTVASINQIKQILPKEMTWDLQIIEKNDNDETKNKQLFKSTIWQSLLQNKPAQLLTMTHWSSFKTLFITINWLGEYLLDLENQGANLWNLSLVSFACGWWDFQLWLYKKLKELWCKTYPRSSYSQANINQLSVGVGWGDRFRYQFGMAIMKHISFKEEMFSVQNINKYESSLWNKTLDISWWYFNDPMIQISNTTIEQQIIKDTITDEELKNFLLDQSAFQIAENDKEKDNFYNIA